MVELDYAYLADYAQIENGKISALGASYTHAYVPSLPSGWLTTVVGRVRAAADADNVALRIEIRPPDGSFEVNYEGEIPRPPHTRPYGGRIGLLFTVTSQFPLMSEGLYTVNVFLNGAHVRRLAFEVEVGREP